MAHTDPSGSKYCCRVMQLSLYLPPLFPEAGMTRESNVTAISSTDQSILRVSSQDVPAHAA